MSMSNWSINGYGIWEDVLNNVSLNNQKQFILKYLPYEYENMIEDCGVTDDNLIYKDWIDNYQPENYDGSGFATLFAKAISDNENGLYVEYYIGEMQTGSILYAERMPWEMTDYVKSMTKEDMEAVFAKYLKDLNITEFEFERHSVEYYG